MNTGLLIAAAFAAGGAVYFAMEWIAAILDRRNLTYLERTALEIDDESERGKQTTLISRFQTELQVLGWRGDLAPVLFALAFLYLAVAAVLRLLGAAPSLGAALALPLAYLALRQLVKVVVARRRRAFNRQLIRALEMLVGQMEAGNGVQRALEMITPLQPDPLREELEGALEAIVASKDLVEALRDVETRYPSRALTLFIAALETERKSAGELGRPIREAASLLRADFELMAELKAETAQQKMAATVMAVGISVIVVGLLAGLDRSAFLTPLGAGALSLGVANFAFGIYRIFSIIRSIEGGS